MAVFNEYGKLKEVILGISSKIYSHDELPKEMVSGLRIRDRLLYPIAHFLFGDRPLPHYLTKQYETELNILEKVLKNHGVIVHRLEAIEPKQEEPRGLIQMFARDPAMMIGNHFLFGNLQIPMRKKERRGYHSLLTSFQSKVIKIDSIDLDSDTFLEGGDVLLDYPYVFVGVNTYASNEKGIEWLQRKLGNRYTVVPVYLSDPTIMHLDCCLTLIGKNLAIIHKNSIKLPLPFPLNQYDFIELDDDERKELAGNVLVLDPKTIILQKRHSKLQTKLEEKGFKVISLEFTEHANSHGAFRCATCPVDRETMQSKHLKGDLLWGFLTF
ncbi:arginine deiminase [Leptospira ryugenii]|uniref:Arginine deiminase n=1 Tax=Leptospira ryugenii TaxID=1917863 RepID=A0A2P2E0H8_9LEPT|nr:arginine deiminase family protein [Leptospira ryugenii]GBF50390.1 arginine deiminase [Leptospira ryugenii]